MERRPESANVLDSDDKSLDPARMDRLVRVMKQDFLFALRQIRRNARFHLLAAATLALGIGATTAIFSLVSGVVLRALPFPNADRLVALRTVEFPAGLPLGMEASAGTPNDTSFPDFFDWRKQNGTFETMATYSYVTRRKFTPGGAGKPQIIEGVHVSSDFFKVLGILPQYGRSFTRDEERAGTCALVISHEFWVREFGGSLSRIGGLIRLSDQACTIVGVMPAGFTFPYRAKGPEFWDNVGFYGRALGLTDRRNRDSNVIARLRKGGSLSLANAEINSIQRRLAESFPEDRNYSVVATDSVAERCEQQCATTVAAAFWFGDRDTADRVRERGGIAGGTRRGAEERVFGAHGIGRERRPNCQASVVGVDDFVGCGGSCGSGAGVRAVEGFSGNGAGEFAEGT